MNKSFLNIFKTTFLFSFVKIVQIFLGVIRNKVIAVYLGAEGIGLIGIFQSSIDLIVSGAGLGISKSAIRDISNSYNYKDSNKLDQTISISRNLYIYTAILGLFSTIVLNKTLSTYTLGKNSFSLDYLFLSIVVFFNILTEGLIAIITGVRKMKILAKLSILGSLVGLLSSVPLYVYFGKSAIVPSLIISSLSAFIFSNFYLSKIEYQKVKLKIRELINAGKPIIKMGFSLMFISFFGLLFNLILLAYLQKYSGMEVVGLYKAGTTVIVTYFGVILTAMTTDYYPRISAVYNDNFMILEEANKQSEVGLLLVAPIAVLFIILAPLFFKYFYSDEFINAIEYTNFAIFGVIFMTVSNCLGMIFIAKQDSKFFTIYSFLHRVIFLIVYILFFNKYSLIGLGIAFLLDVLVQFIFYYIFLIKRHNIKLGNYIIIQIIYSIALVLSAVLVSLYFDGLILIFSGVTILLISVIISLFRTRKLLFQ